MFPSKTGGKIGFFSPPDTLVFSLSDPKVKNDEATHNRRSFFFGGISIIFPSERGGKNSDAAFRSLVRRWLLIPGKNWSVPSSSSEKNVARSSKAFVSSERTEKRLFFFFFFTQSSRVRACVLEKKRNRERRASKMIEQAKVDPRGEREREKREREALGSSGQKFSMYWNLTDHSPAERGEKREREREVKNRSSSSVVRPSSVRILSLSSLSRE